MCYLLRWSNCMDGNPYKVINHGRDILRELAGKSFVGKAKALLTKCAVRFVQVLFGATFLFAGLCAGDVLTQVIK